MIPDPNPRSIMSLLENTVIVCVLPQQRIYCEDKPPQNGRACPDQIGQAEGRQASRRRRTRVRRTCRSAPGDAVGDRAVGLLNPAFSLVRPQVNGVLPRFMKEGDRVKAGQPLFRLIRGPCGLGYQRVGLRAISPARPGERQEASAPSDAK